jgi:hypothetical protein
MVGAGLKVLAENRSTNAPDRTAGEALGREVSSWDRAMPDSEMRQLKYDGEHAGETRDGKGSGVRPAGRGALTLGPGLA